MLPYVEHPSLEVTKWFKSIFINLTFYAVFSVRKSIVTYSEYLTKKSHDGEKVNSSPEAYVYIFSKPFVCAPIPPLPPGPLRNLCISLHRPAGLNRLWGIGPGCRPCNLTVWYQGTWWTRSCFYHRPPGLSKLLVKYLDNDDGSHNLATFF